MAVVRQFPNKSHRTRRFRQSIPVTIGQKSMEEFGRGFSVANIKNFRQFYLTFPDPGKSYTLCSLLSWSHLRLIMRLENSQARDFYLREAAEQNWSVRVLDRNIKTLTFERLLDAPEKREMLSAGQIEHLIGDLSRTPTFWNFSIYRSIGMVTKPRWNRRSLSGFRLFCSNSAKGFPSSVDKFESVPKHRISTSIWFSITIS